MTRSSSDLFRTALVSGSALLAIAGAPVFGQTIELERTVSGHLALDVGIGDHGDFTFALDTGANRTAIAQDVAERLGFVSTWSAPDDVQSLTRLFEAELFHMADIDVPQLEPQNLNMVVVPVPPTHSSDVAGLLGLDAFQGLRYRIDFQNARIDLNPDHEFQGDGRVDPGYGLLFGAARLGSTARVARVIIDSGSPYTIANPTLHFRFMSRDGIRYRISGVDGRTGDDADYFTVRQFRIGNLCIRRHPILQADLDIFHAVGWQGEPAIVIGMDILAEARVTIDRRTGEWDIDPAGSAFHCSSSERVNLDALGAD
jgi:hypothetical protein